MDSAPVLAPPERRVSATRMARLNDLLVGPEGALQEALRLLVARVAGALGASLADANGLPIASTFPDRGDLRLASAMATMIAKASKGVLDGLGKDRFLSVTIEGAANVVVACEVSEGAGSLILVVERGGDLDAASREIVRTAMEVTTILDLDVC